MNDFCGHLSLIAAVRDHGRTVLTGQSFRAPYHISKPYWDADTRALLVQVVNPTAGILSGDYLASQVAVQSDAALLVTTPSASRLFQMCGGEAECRQHFAVSARGWLEVMPEPLVPHRGSRYRQATSIDVDSQGTLFFVDQLMPGRVGRGEAWVWDWLCLELTVRVGGELVLRERLAQTGDQLREMAELSGSGATACFANAVLIDSVSASHGAPSWLREVSELHGDGLWLGVSALRAGGWSMKLVARDGMRLREALGNVRRILATTYPRLGSNLRKL